MSFLYTLNLGSTNKFFMPWLVPRNDATSVYQQNILGKLFSGRRKRELTFHDSTVLKNIAELDAMYSACNDISLKCLLQTASHHHAQLPDKSDRTEILRFSHILESDLGDCKQIYNDCVMQSISAK